MEGRVWWIFLEYDDVGDDDDDDVDDDDVDDDGQLTYLPNACVSHEKLGEGVMHYCHIVAVKASFSLLMIWHPSCMMYPMYPYVIESNKFLKCCKWISCFLDQLNCSAHS